MPQYLWGIMKNKKKDIRKTRKIAFLLLMLTTIMWYNATTAFANGDTLNYESLNQSEDTAELEKLHDVVAEEIAQVRESESNVPVSVDDIDFANSIKIYKYTNRIFSNDARKILDRLESAPFEWELYVESEEDMYQVSVAQNDGAWEVSSAGTVDRESSYITKLLQHEKELKEYDNLVCVAGLKDLYYPVVLCISDYKLQAVFLFESKGTYRLSNRLKKDDNIFYIDAGELTAIYKRDFLKRNIWVWITVVLFLTALFVVRRRKKNR